MTSQPSGFAALRPRCIEFFAGIGGFAASYPNADVVAAIDINRLAEETYRRNHVHPFFVREIDSLTPESITSFNADFWWLSPPCQPYSVRGERRDVQDPRSRPLLHLINAIDRCRPSFIGLENVSGFASSVACERLHEQLQTCGYHVRTIELCPSQMGWPNRRPRFYLLASQQPLLEWSVLPTHKSTLDDHILPLSREESGQLWLADEILLKYVEAIDRVDAADLQAVTACFAGSYGKAILHSGSYLASAGGYRRFAPREVARLLGFPDSYALDHLPLRNAWKLLGNSLSLPAVRYVLSHFR